MLSTSNTIIEGRNGRPVSLDLTYLADGKPKPVIVFAHGFKGFKDWGHWSLIGAAFARKGYVFLKFNFSFNGTTPDQPLDFADLEAFGNNNYSKELDDMDTVLDWLFKEGENRMPGELDLSKTAMIGHSRGGPLAIIKSYEDDRLKAAVTWASVHSLSYAWSSESFVDNWKKEGVFHVLNGRTGQSMPLYYQLYEDCQVNTDRFDIERILTRFEKPLLLVHGTDDPAVPFASAAKLHGWYPKSQMSLIEGADHVFGGRHPFTEKDLPEHSKQLVNLTHLFFENLRISRRFS